MIAQLYTDHDPIVRIFDDTLAIADLPLPYKPGFFAGQEQRNVSIQGAKVALRRIGLQAKEKWIRCEWGWETRVSFVRLRRPEK